MINPYDLLKRIEYLERLERPDTPGRYMTEHKLGGLIAYLSLFSINIDTGAAWEAMGLISEILANGAPVISAVNGMPYAILDGVDDYYGIVDVDEIKITGLESVFHSSVQGLTCGGWLYLDDATPATATLWAKWGTSASTRSFRLYVDTDGLVKFAIRDEAESETEIVSETALEAGRWYFLGASFVPGVSMSLLVDTEEISETDSIPAEIFDSTADVTIGAIDGGTLRLDGGVASCFLYANQHSTDELRRLYEAGRFFFQQDE